MAEIIEYTNVFNMDGTPYVVGPENDKPISWAKVELYEDHRILTDYKIGGPLPAVLYSLDVLRHEVIQGSRVDTP